MQMIMQLWLDIQVEECLYLGTQSAKTIMCVHIYIYYVVYLYIYIYTIYIYWLYTHLPFQPTKPTCCIFPMGASFSSVHMPGNKELLRGSPTMAISPMYISWKYGGDNQLLTKLWIEFRHLTNKYRIFHGDMRSEPTKIGISLAFIQNSPEMFGRLQRSWWKKFWWWDGNGTIMAKPSWIEILLGRNWNLGN